MEQLVLGRGVGPCLTSNNAADDVNSDATATRKDSHIALCLEEQIEFYSADSNGFSQYRFEHDALPELDYSQIRIDTTLFGRKLAAPLIIGAMTGGTDRAAGINRRLALAAEACQIGFALGSQRRMLAEDTSSAVIESYAVRRFAPKLPLLFGNLGAVQLNYGATPELIRKLIERTGCDAFNFHLNPLQEAIQPEGDRNFSGLVEKLEACIPVLGVPCLVKEVGAGISEVTAKKLARLPLKGVEVAGLGGTSWSKIESLRAKGTLEGQVGALFARWGIPTAESLVTCRATLPHHTIIASGGIRNGIEIAKAIALGADAAAMALPFLKAAEISVEAVIQVVERLIAELKTALFVTGAGSLERLRERGPSFLKRIPDRAASVE